MGGFSKNVCQIFGQFVFKPEFFTTFASFTSLNFILEYQGLNTILQNELSFSETSFSKFFVKFLGSLGPQILRS